MLLPVSANNRFYEINLKTLLNEIGEDQTKVILSSFSCPLNRDVEQFLSDKSIEFSKRSFSQTHLVFWIPEDKKQKELVGYYALASKVMSVSRGSISKTQGKKLREQGIFEAEKDAYVVSAALIGQLGKNFSNGNNLLISGDELLALALARIKRAQNEIGGRFAYLECEDKEPLLAFYKRNGFFQFGKRRLDRDETGIDGDYLIQLLIML